MPFPPRHLLLPREQSHRGGATPGVSPEAQPLEEGSASGETVPRGEWVCSQLCDCLRWGARWGCLRILATPVGLREAGCDLIFLMVLSLVLLGCGGSLPSPTPERGMLGDWKHLNFLFY